MKPKKRQKLCHNCDGEIDIDVIVCPFCAADLREEKPEQRYSSYITNVDQSYQSQPQYSESTESAADELAEEGPPVAFDEEEADVKPSTFLPTVLFTLGIQLCVLSLLMLLFSHKGAVILKWDARYWFVYLLISVPFLSFGYRAIKKL